MANNIIITGNICHDLEIKQNGETKILNFTVAVRRKFKNKNGEYETDFIRCVAFNKQCDFLNNYFKKGSPILIQGNLQSNTYETQTGEKRTSYNVIVENIDFFGRRNEQTSNDTPNPSFEQTMKQNGAEINVVDDGLQLPF